MQKYSAVSYQSVPEQITTDILDGEYAYISFVNGGSVSLKGGLNAGIGGPQAFQNLATAISQAAEDAGLLT
jgi:hypothetical protein